MDTVSYAKEHRILQPNEYACDQCGISMSIGEKAEHEDWHMAMDLQQQEQSSSAINSTPSSAPVSSPPKQNGDHKKAPSQNNHQDGPPPTYAAPSGPPPSTTRAAAYHHSNIVTKAADVRARDEQIMQNRLQSLQYQYRIYNTDIEPEHETDYPCSCPICQFKRLKWNRYPVQRMWSDAVIYPGK